jgi:hypothetical protein
MVLTGTASALNWQTLHLKNGWAGTPYGTRLPAIAIDADGIVHLRGAMTNSVSPDCSHIPFVIPRPFRPTGGGLYEPVDEENSATGRIGIAGDGSVEIDPPSSSRGDDTALCNFTSLEGISYAR